MSWQPSSSPKAWQQRAKLYQSIRAFFEERDVLEVDTPLLCPHTVTDPHIQSFAVPHTNGHDYFLQTSPEFAMKRLLAHHPVAIYQLCKAFRKEESGRQHQAEFTMLEWYRPDWSLHELIAEVGALLHTLLDSPPVTTHSYQELFERHCNINPHVASLAQLQQCLKDAGVVFGHALPDHKDDALNCLMTHVIEPKVDPATPIAIIDFPASQAALARIEKNPEPVAKRFEIYYQNVELANGYDELRDADEQRQRMSADNLRRSQLGLPTISPDEHFIDALQHGLPACCGVAMGIDRLMMIAYGYNDIRNTLCFAT
jgi:elongation factor P--(R)-beta-lysine ligase